MYATLARRTLQYNQITGTIPDAIATLTALTTLCVAAPFRCLPLCAASPHRHYRSLAPLLHVHVPFYHRPLGLIASRGECAGA